VIGSKQYAYLVRDSNGSITQVLKNKGFEKVIARKWSCIEDLAKDINECLVGNECITNDIWFGTFMAKLTTKPNLILSQSRESLKKVSSLDGIDKAILSRSIKELSSKRVFSSINSSRPYNYDIYNLDSNIK
jgi:hypothetical protein